MQAVPSRCAGENLFDTSSGFSLYALCVLQFMLQLPLPLIAGFDPCWTIDIIANVSCITLTTKYTVNDHANSTI